MSEIGQGLFRTSIHVFSLVSCDSNRLCFIGQAADLIRPKYLVFQLLCRLALIVFSTLIWAPAFADAAQPILSDDAASDDHTTLTNRASEPALPNKSGPTLALRYPEVQDEYYREFDAYFLKQMHQAMQKAGVSYEATPVPTPTLVESRSEMYLSEGRYNVHWMNANPRRESRFIPVRVPLFKGLFGWRVSLIRKGQQELFSGITSLEELKKMKVGSGHDWPDTPIYRANGMNMELSTQWRSLFLMLSIGRFDYFPRSVIEIWREVKLFADLDIVVEQHFALHYPAAYYFFVSKQNPELADALERGLHASLADGSFDALFYEHFREIIDRAKLSERRIITLENNLNTFPTDPSFWFSPGTRQ